MPISDLETLLRSMEPFLHPGRYAFVTLPPDAPLGPERIIASIREPEGLSVIVREEVATEQGLRVAFLASWITLLVNSDLQAVGLTAAVATALTAAGVSCNVVAGVHHDHLFVPIQKGEAAMAVLRTLQKEGPHAGGA